MTVNLLKRIVYLVVSTLSVMAPTYVNPHYITYTLLKKVVNDLHVQK